ncbi:MAG: hypothetical protein ABH865_04360 [Candidatus Omnitrophota bacterium]
MNILKTVGTRGIKKIYTSPVIPIFIFCAAIVYFFHFDIFLSSDSAWSGIASMQLLRRGLQYLPYLDAWGLSYLFGYYLIQYFLLNLLQQGLSSNLMEALNLITGAVSVCNVTLIYVMFRKISFNKMLSSCMAIFYFFIPMVFQLSLYTNPNTYSLFFFISSNIFFISYLLDSKKTNLVLLLFFSVLSLLVRVDTILSYCSFLSWALVLNKSFKRALFVCFFTMFVSFIIFVIIQKLLLGQGILDGRAFTGFSSLDYDFFNVRSMVVAIGHIFFSAGIGLVCISLFFIARCLYLRDFKIPLATLIWIFPVLVYITIMAKYHVSRYCVISFIGFLLPVGFIARSFCGSKKKRIVIFFIMIGIIVFGSMPLSYFLVKTHYPLRKHYKPGERIVVEYTPLGNIFTNAYSLREEKRRAWYTAEQVIRKYNKVIVVADNTCILPYIYFLYYLFENVGQEEVTVHTRRYTAFNRELIFIDIGLERDRTIAPRYDRKIVLDCLNNPLYDQFVLLVPPYICERDRQLCDEMEKKCSQEKRILVKVNDPHQAQ